MKLTVRMDSTQVVQELKCSDLHNFVSVQNLTRKFEDKQAMDRGTVFHGLLERYYQKLWEREMKDKAMSYAVSQLTGDWAKEIKLTAEDYKFLTLRFVDYCMQYGNDNVEILTSANGKPAIELGFSYPLLDNDDYFFVLEGKIDLIRIMNSKRVIVDHKFQGREYLLYGRSIQSLNYRLATDSDIFVYNYIRGHKKVQPNTFETKTNTITKRDLIIWKAKLIEIFKTKAHGPYADTQYPNQSCTDIGFGKKCPFTLVCEQPTQALKSAILNRDFMTRPKWEPWNLEDLGEYDAT